MLVASKGESKTLIAVDNTPITKLSEADRDYNRRLIEASPSMLAVLNELEWSHYSENWGPACPKCGGHKDHGHHGERVNVNIKPDCKLWLTLRGLRQP
jgi:hypothetical protein